MQILGRLIAIMLGRLQMTVDECIDAYLELSDQAFGKWRVPLTWTGKVCGRFDSGALESVIKQIIHAKGLAEDALFEDEQARCKV